MFGIYCFCLGQYLGEGIANVNRIAGTSTKKKSLQNEKYERNKYSAEVPKIDLDTKEATIRPLERFLYNVRDTKLG